MPDPARAGDTTAETLRHWSDAGYEDACQCATAYKGRHQGEPDCPVTSALEQAARAVALVEQQQQDHRLVAMLLSHLYRIYDAGGISSGRSWESRLVEPALELMDPHRPHEDIVTWPDREETIRRAERVSVRPLRGEEPRHVDERRAFVACDRCEWALAVPNYAKRRELRELTLAVGRG